MKLRIANIYSDTRMAGSFVIQKRCWLFWWVMATEITDSYFDSLADARESVVDYKQGRARKSFRKRILRTYDVEVD